MKWALIGYIPSGLHERGGIDTRQVSRSLEVGLSMSPERHGRRN